MAAEFELYGDVQGRYRLRLRHQNGNVIAKSGEGFWSKNSALDSVNAVKENAPGAQFGGLVRPAGLLR